MAHKLANALAEFGSDNVYLQALSHWRPEDQLILGANEHPSAITNPPPLPSLDPFERMMVLDSVSYLPDDILCKVDRATMAASLEARIPMLDHRVVEFASSLPLSYKAHGGVGKLPLRKVLLRHVPCEIIDRPKMGFGVPIGTWLRGPLRDWAENLLEERRLQEQGIFNPQIVRARWQEHLNGRNWQYQLWDVLMVQSWIDAQTDI
jgi:asparagine synthase (glutamine-hydrolysing)